MKYKSFCLYIALSLFYACTKDAEPEQKQFPMIRTLHVTDIDSDGATFNAEFVNLGYNEIIRYGFVFDTDVPGIDSSDTVILSVRANKGVFSQTIHKGLAGNVYYLVRAFAETQDHIIYGNYVGFQSIGCQWTPWELIFQSSMAGWHDAYGTSKGKLGYILFQSEDFYSYNPATNKVSKLKSIPIDGNTGTSYASFNLGKYIYVLTNGSDQVLRYNTENNQWSNDVERPFKPNPYAGFFGFSINNAGYFLSGGNFYSYHELSRRWSKKADIPSMYIYSVQVVGNNVYALADNKEIWKYSPEEDTWSKKIHYPGEWHGKIVGFSLNDKIYWGLSYSGSYSGASFPASDMWEYSPNTNLWRKVDDFPLLHSQNEIVAFSTGSLCYFGYRDPNYTNQDDTYLIYSFNPEKME